MAFRRSTPGRTGPITRTTETHFGFRKEVNELLKMLRQRIQDDKGFTLIELMVVVLIIAILIAIAIPTFLGLRTRAQDRAAQSDLRNALTAAKAFYTDDETYTGFTVAKGEEVEPSLNWVLGAPAANTDQLGIDDGTTGNTARFLRHSASGTYFCIQDVNGVTGYGDGANAAAAEADCAAVEW
jgi:type IV pilus assembly protein PilA